MQVLATITSLNLRVIKEIIIIKNHAGKKNRKIAADDDIIE